MQIRPLVLRREIMDCLNEVQKSIDEVVREARNKGTEPHILRSASGGWALPPLLVAKAQLLAALVSINDRENK